ncbi:MAG: L,D-transpeptidase family protein [Proteobacteria bacterium]|nr:L,D-transpeptidase family protein [Pseudomonadota bacterium]MDA0993164.1 L,D-transpeptidase family protein [Pseudomonadota bacterium]
MGQADNKRTGLVSCLMATLILIPGVMLPATASDFPVADKILVEKASRKLHLLSNGIAFRTFKIALGFAPDGTKVEEGDQKTPEGYYLLDGRNPDSEYFLSIHISYPNTADRMAAARKGVSPGGQIMIHGQPNNPTFSAGYYAREDWTNGCIAVSNSDMIDIWLMTPNSVPIEIRP